MGSRRADILGVLAVVGLTTGVVVVGGAAGDFRSKWYVDLRKPAWQPSGAAIAAVWSVLYVTIATAGSLLWLQRRRASPGVATLFVAQSVLNAAWTVLFTRAKSPVLNQIAGLLNVEVERLRHARYLALRLGGIAGDQAEALNSRPQAMASKHLEHAARRDDVASPHR